jgi:hypothetical protein
VNIEVLSYETEPADESVGWPGGVYDVDFSVTNASGREMRWLDKYITEKQYKAICEYVAEKVLF